MLFLRKVGIFGTAVCGLCIAKSTKLFKFADAKSGDADEEKFADAKDQGLRLKFVQVFFRHGARTPLSVIPNPNNLPELEQVWDKETLFSGGAGFIAQYEVKSLDGGPQPESELENHYRKTIHKGGSFGGQLTTIGKQQMHQLGQEYKKYYIDALKFLDSQLKPEDIYIRSSNLSRTIESAACVVAGMFGNDSNEHGRTTIFVNSNKDEILYPNDNNCKNLKVWTKQLWENNDIVPGIRHFRCHIQDMLGIPESGHLKLVSLRDVMIAQKSHGLPCPPILDVMMDVIEKCAVDTMAFYLDKPGKGRLECVQMTSGRVVHMIRENLQNAAKTEKKVQKFHMYSCHDTTLIAVLSGLDIFDNQWPPYAADLVFELYEDKEGRHYVKTKYLGMEQYISKCKDAILPLDEFLKLTSHVSVSFDKYNTVCGNNLNDATPV